MKSSTFKRLPLWAQLLCCLLVLAIVFLAIFGQQWPGHHHTTYPEDHPFVPLEALLERVYNLRIEK